MKLRRLALRDFRGFETLDLRFEEDVTALVGINGAGKTSILDALAHLLTCLTEGVRTGAPAIPDLSDGDVRVGASVASIELTAEIDGDERSWRLTHSLPGRPHRVASDVASLHEPIESAQRSIEDGSPSLPLAVYYLTNRNVLDIPDRIRTRHEFDALSAYDGALDEGSTSFRQFFEWFREEEDVYNEGLVRRARPGNLFTTEETTPIEPSGSRLMAVRRAIESLFPEAKDLRIERRPQRMTMLRDGVRLDVAQLSDGERCLLALAGDLARRMVLAAPAAGSALLSRAVVLIDEIELHLHPRLQREILPRLQRTFPGTQFVVTTHSPQVLSSVHGRNVRLLERFALRNADASTWRRHTNDILQGIFGDPGRPPEVATKVNALRDAVDQDRHEDARRHVRELQAMIEGHDPEVLFLANLLPPQEDPAAEPT